MVLRQLFTLVQIVCSYYLQVNNHDLLHAVIALYSVSLSEMTPDVLYSTVCDKWARTIILLRDINGNLYVHKLSDSLFFCS